jgi:hypothetical protein
MAGTISVVDAYGRVTYCKDNLPFNVLQNSNSTFPKSISSYLFVAHGISRYAILKAVSHWEFATAALPTSCARGTPSRLSIFMRRKKDHVYFDGEMGRLRLLQWRHEACPFRRGPFIITLTSVLPL